MLHLLTPLSLALAALALAVPALAQTAPAAASSAAVEPARLAAARLVIDRLWPLGTYERVMKATLDGITGGMMNQMMGMKVGDFAGMAGPDKADEVKKAAGDATMGEVAEQADPHFRERFDIMMRVMMAEMTVLISRAEPDVREGLSRAYARRFTTDQLAEINRFFASPTGAIYARESMMLMTDPELMQAMQSFTPELLKAMPAIMEKVEKATAHLPPPPKQKAAQDD